MKTSLLPILRCPDCSHARTARDLVEAEREIERGTLACSSCGHTDPAVGVVPRFIPQENHADDFGFQWNLFRQAQHSEAAFRELASWSRAAASPSTCTRSSCDVHPV